VWNTLEGMCELLSMGIILREEFISKIADRFAEIECSSMRKKTVS
jgi:hypothetical protein